MKIQVQQWIGRVMLLVFAWQLPAAYSMACAGIGDTLRAPEVLMADCDEMMPELTGPSPSDIESTDCCVSVCGCAATSQVLALDRCTEISDFGSPMNAVVHQWTLQPPTESFVRPPIS